jgi:SAM-dependent methyltransferase
MNDSFTTAERQALIAWFKDHAVSRMWITREGEGVRLTGFVVNADARLEQLALLVNDEILRRADWKQWPDLDDCGPNDFRALRWWPGVHGYGFDTYFRFDELESLAAGLGAVKVEICNTEKRRLCDRTQAMFLSGEDAKRRLCSPEPPKSLMDRVMGRDDAAAEWHLTGYCNLRVFDQVMHERTGVHIASIGNILEWGSGCGRLSRPLIRLPKTKFTGIDIDRDAVAWCNANLASGTRGRARFDACGLLPPTTLPDASFGLAIGVSVITHLNEPIGNAWLAELARVLEPGGYLLLTTHGMDTFSVINDPDVLRSMRTKGFYSVKSGLLNVILGDHQEYYRETWHSWDYIRANWTRWFNVIGISRGGHMGYQDLVVLQRR